MTGVQTCALPICADLVGVDHGAVELRRAVVEVEIGIGRLVETDQANVPEGLQQTSAGGSHRVRIFRNVQQGAVELVLGAKDGHDRIGEGLRQGPRCLKKQPDGRPHTGAEKNEKDGEPPHREHFI